MNSIAYLVRPPRRLADAIAHCIANTPSGNVEREALLNRLYRSLNYAERLLCRIELAQTKRAKRGELEATVGQRRAG